MGGVEWEGQRENICMSGLNRAHRLTGLRSQAHSLRPQAHSLRPQAHTFSHRLIPPVHRVTGFRPEAHRLQVPGSQAAGHRVTGS